MKKLSLIAAMFLLAVLAAVPGFSAENATGRWEGTFEAEGFDTLPIGINLKADGNKLTGTYDDMSGLVEIRNGKFDGKKLSFDVTLAVGEFHMEGEITGDNPPFKPDYIKSIIKIKSS